MGILVIIVLIFIIYFLLTAKSRRNKTIVNFIEQSYCMKNGQELETYIYWEAGKAFASDLGFTQTEQSMAGERIKFEYKFNGKKIDVTFWENKPNGRLIIIAVDKKFYENQARDKIKNMLE